MTALEGSTVKISTLVDGTLRLVLDFEPQHAQEAFRLFGAPGRGVAVAALVDGRAALLQPPAAPKPVPKPRIRSDEVIAAAAQRWHAKGPLERAAIELCASIDFQQFMGADDANEAASKLKALCGIGSRKVLDLDKGAGQDFREKILDPFNQQQREKGLAHESHD